VWLISHGWCGEPFALIPLCWQEHDYTPFYLGIRQANYQGRISIHSISEDIVEDGRESIQMIGEAFDQGFEFPDERSSAAASPPIGVALTPRADLPSLV
jgi:hypothetical protein